MKPTVIALAALTFIGALAISASLANSTLRSIEGLPYGPFMEWLVYRPVGTALSGMMGLIGAAWWDPGSKIGPALMLLAGIGILISWGWVAVILAIPLFIAALLAFFWKPDPTTEPARS